MSYLANLQDHYKAVSRRLSPPPPPPIVSSANAPEVVAQSVAYFGAKAQARAIIDQVALAHKLALNEMLSDSKATRLVAARIDACRRIRAEVKLKGAPLSYEQIGLLVHLHHTTIMHHLKTGDHK